MELPPHLAVKNTSTAGRTVVTTTPIALGSAVLYTLPYAVGVFDSHRKRLCSYLPCSLYAANNFFTSRCSACDQAFYCSAICHERDVQKHALACGALKKLRGWAKDRHAASVLKLVVLVLAEHRWTTLLNLNLQSSLGRIDNEDDMLRSVYYSSLIYRPGVNTDVAGGTLNGLDAYLSHLSLSRDADRQRNSISRPTFSDVMTLQSHVCSWPREDAHDWEQHASFAMSLFDKSPDLLPDQWGFQDILHLASRIEVASLLF